VRGFEVGTSETSMRHKFTSRGRGSSCARRAEEARAGASGAVGCRIIFYPQGVK
jgi:hypothetical protein